MGNRERGETDLEGVEVSVPVKIHLGGYPLAGTLVFFIETHEQHGVYRVDDSVADTARLGEVRARVADGVILVVAHCIALCCS